MVVGDIRGNSTGSGNGRGYTPRGGAFTDYRGPIWKFVQEKVGAAYKRKLSAVEACNSWYSAAFLMETVPSVIYILMKHGRDLEEAIVRAVNDTRDNDTIAAIVGAAVGALHGKKSDSGKMESRNCQVGHPIPMTEGCLGC